MSPRCLARQWGAWLAGVSGLNVVFFDERYTTVEAEVSLRSQGMRRKGRESRRDMLAACLLLQNYLDAGCPRNEAAPAALDDPVDAPETEEPES